MNIHNQDVHFVLGLEGKPTAILVDISLWERIIQALEDAEDISLAKEALIALDAAVATPPKQVSFPGQMKKLNWNGWMTPKSRPKGYLTPKAYYDLKKLPENIRRQMIIAVDWLEVNLRPT